MHLPLPTRSLAPRGLSFDLQEWSGAFGDLGLTVPIIAALVLTNGLSAASVLLVFGIAYIFSALYYRLPMPVQPLKAMAATAIAQGLDPEMLSAAAFLMAALLLLAAIGLVRLLARLFTRPVVRGIQAAVGLLLLKAGLTMALSDQLLRGHGEMFAPRSWLDVPLGVPVALGAVGILALGLWKRRLPTALLVLAAGVVAGLAAGSAHTLAGLRPAPDLPHPAIPEPADFVSALVLLVVPQIPLTLGNAVFACADTARGYFGERASRVTHRSLLSTMGVANLVAGALGGMPVCHGAGGLTAHYRFGARTAGAGIIIGSLLLGLGLAFGSRAVDLFAVVPYPVFGVMLAAVGVQHALLARDCRRPDEIAVVATAALTALALSNIAIGFAAGIALYFGLAALRGGRSRLPLRCSDKASWPWAPERPETAPVSDGEAT